jgi:hypothetical protein
MSQDRVNCGCGRGERNRIPAPVGFADIVERVKPAVVGVQVKIDGVTTLDEPQQEAPP